MKNAMLNRFSKRYLVPIGIIAFLTLLVLVSLTTFLREARRDSGVVISEDIEQLVGIFKRIDATCEILGFDHQRNPIDFLTVKDFSGSEVGSMDLAYPEKWEGPYLEDNLTIQGRYYHVVAAAHGSYDYYIVPDNGVQLENGKVIGRDIIIDKQTDFAALMRDPQGLLVNGVAMIAPLALK